MENRPGRVEFCIGYTRECPVRVSAKKFWFPSRSTFKVVFVSIKQWHLLKGFGLYTSTRWYALICSIYHNTYYDIIPAISKYQEVCKNVMKIWYICVVMIHILKLFVSWYICCSLIKFFVLSWSKSRYIAHDTADSRYISRYIMTKYNTILNRIWKEGS